MGNLPPGAGAALLNFTLSEMFKDAAFGRAVLELHGWKWNASLLRMEAPNGRLVKLNVMGRLKDSAAMLRVLEAGGTPWKF